MRKLRPKYIIFPLTGPFFLTRNLQSLEMACLLELIRRITTRATRDGKSSIHCNFAARNKLHPQNITTASQDFTSVTCEKFLSIKTAWLR